MCANRPRDESRYRLRLDHTGYAVREVTINGSTPLAVSNSGGDHVANATITQTFDSAGNCLSLSMSVDYDAIDSPESLEMCVRNAAVLWHVTDGES